MVTCFFSKNVDIEDRDQTKSAILSMDLSEV